MYILEKKFKFEAAHWLKGHEGGCASIHGHSYILHVYIGCDNLVNDMVIDFGDVKHIIEPIVEELDHATIVNLNEDDIPIRGDIITKCYFVHGRPTAENMAKKLFELIKLYLTRYPHCQLLNVKLQETEGNTITYSDVTFG